MIDGDYILRSISQDMKPGTLYLPVDFAEMVNGAPTIDAVEVLRCRECKYWLSVMYPTEGICQKTRLGRKNDDFCSRGEEKSNDQADNGSGV